MGPLPLLEQGGRMGYAAAQDEDVCQERGGNAAPSRRAMIVGGVLLAFCCAAVAAQGISASRGGEGGRGSSSELLYIDSYGEKQHVHVDSYVGRTQELAGAPPAHAAKAAAAARVAKKKASQAGLLAEEARSNTGGGGYDDAPILDALAEHENRDKKVDMTLKAMHQMPAPPKVWRTKKVRKICGNQEEVEIKRTSASSSVPKPLDNTITIPLRSAQPKSGRHGDPFAGFKGVDVGM